MARLCISRGDGEAIVIDHVITVTVHRDHKDRLRLVVEAPRDVQVDRKEIYELKKQKGEL